MGWRVHDAYDRAERARRSILPLRYRYAWWRIALALALVALFAWRWWG